MPVSLVMKDLSVKEKVRKDSVVRTIVFHDNLLLLKSPIVLLYLMVFIRTLFSYALFDRLKIFLFADKTN